jgi:archaellum biogenesis protein FlaJ (TadC family)
MSRMTVSDRNQFERADLRESSDHPRTPIGRRAAIIYTAIALVVLAALIYASFQVFAGLPHLIVLAVIIIVVLGLAAWVNPTRRNV